MFELKLYLHERIPEISCGFRIRSRRGVMWRVISKCSRVLEF